MTKKVATSTVYKAPYPELFIPEQLRSKITIKQFWYQKLISLFVALWYLGTKPFRTKPEEPSPEQKIPLEGESTVEGETPLEEKPEVEGEYCHANKDGDCSWDKCPQLRDGEPGLSGRHCPLDKMETE